ncbi:hypothetical protein [Streptomyces sirii]
MAPAPPHAPTTPTSSADGTASLPRTTPRRGAAAGGDGGSRVDSSTPRCC